MNAPDIILKLSNIESYYGPIMAIRGISLEVPRAAPLAPSSVTIRLSQKLDRALLRIENSRNGLEHRGLAALAATSRNGLADRAELDSSAGINVATPQFSVCP